MSLLTETKTEKKIKKNARHTPPRMYVVKTWVPNLYIVINVCLRQVLAKQVHTMLNKHRVNLYISQDTTFLHCELVVTSFTSTSKCVRAGEESNEEYGRGCLQKKLKLNLNPPISTTSDQ